MIGGRSRCANELEPLCRLPHRRIHNICSAQDAHFFGSDSSVGGISQHIQSSGQTRSRLEELTTANRRKDEFLAMLGHELRFIRDGARWDNFGTVRS